MRVYIYATEGIYQGLHGIYNCQVVDVNDIEEANDYGYEMAYNVAESFGLNDEDETIEQLQKHETNPYTVVDEIVGNVLK